MGWFGFRLGFLLFCGFWWFLFLFLFLTKNEKAQTILNVNFGGRLFLCVTPAVPWSWLFSSCASSSVLHWAKFSLGSQREFFALVRTRFLDFSTIFARNWKFAVKREYCCHKAWTWFCYDKVKFSAFPNYWCRIFVCMQELLWKVQETMERHWGKLCFILRWIILGKGRVECRNIAPSSTMYQANVQFWNSLIHLKLWEYGAGAVIVYSLSKGQCGTLPDAFPL